MTFERDALGENPAWQEVYRWLQQFLQLLRLGAGRHPLALDDSNWLLDAHIAQAQLMLHLIESQLEWQDGQDVAGFNLASIFGDLLTPWLSIGRMRQVHVINLRAYAELLHIYLQLLEEIRHETDAHPPSASKLEKYRLG